jgi:CRP/FNR family cyclic AMP-dependent transcriptional regulator
MRMGSSRTYARGDILMGIGQLGTDVYLITRGCVKVIGDTFEGSQALLAVRMAGDLVGEIAFLDRKPRSATVSAAGLVTARVIPAASLHEHMSASPTTAAAVQAAVTAKLRETVRDRIDFNNGAPVATRLARAIYKLATVYGLEVPEGVLITAPLSQADLCSLIGTTEQSVRRSLAAFRDDGLVQVHYRRLIITDVGRLEKMAGART